ncbi:MAG: hypothetical protein M1457_12375 [bacterium]|nr:hypothetical protein [bacterium]
MNVTTKPHINAVPRRRAMPADVHPAALLGAALAMLIVAGCGGARMKHLSDQQYARLAADDKVDVYVGSLDLPSQPVAVIESDAYAYVDDAVRQRQIDQLKSRARALGANTIQDVRILAKHVRGYTADERVPFAAWKQGQYELYFMRGTACRVAEVEPRRFDDLEPKGGWMVDKLTPPQKLEKTLEAIPGPGPRPQ